MPPAEPATSYHSPWDDATAISSPNASDAPPRSSPQPAWIALGTNLGDRRATLERALRWLAAMPGVTLVAVSDFHRTAAVGPPQPDYLNAVARVATTLSPRALLAALQALESAAQRVRRERWGARTLDLDLLLYGDRAYADGILTLPHPHLTERAFVLVPLVELDPHLVHPPTGRTMADHLAALQAVRARSAAAPAGELPAAISGSTPARDLL